MIDEHEHGDLIGDIIDGLGCTVSLDDGDLVADAVIVLKVVEPDGTVRLAVSWSENMSWIERLGMLRAAEKLEAPCVTDPHET